MNVVDLLRVDLNLLVALQALLEERNVTRAARRCGVTQSSMSHALARLRTMFGDPLLVREGRGMVVTPRGEALAGPLQEVLAGAQRLLRGGGGFVPAQSTRRFVLSCPDLLGTFLPELLAAITGPAPGVRLALRLPLGEPGRRLLEGEVDLALGPVLPEGPGLRQRALGSIHWVVLARAGHPALARRFTRKAWLAYPHVVVSTGGVGEGVLGRALASEGLTRRVGLEVPSFMLAPLAVARSDCFFAGPLELLGPLASSLGLVHRPLPLPLPPTRVGMTWAERLHADEGHRWFRDRVAEVVEQVLTPTASRR